MKKIMQSLVAASVLCAPLANAGSLTQTNEGRTGAVGNGWLEIERNGYDPRINGRLLALGKNSEDRTSRFGQRTVRDEYGTLELTGVMLSYDWAGSSRTTANDSTFAQWRVTGSGSWNRLVEHALGGSSLTGDVMSFGTTAANKASLDFSRYVGLSRSDQYAFSDNIVLTARMAMQAVPEPATYILVLFALLGWLASRCRSRT
ncbi:MAG: PEP-CTERM sorting domain-containing protein [Pseudomonadota bacterium]